MLVFKTLKLTFGRVKFSLTFTRCYGNSFNELLSFKYSPSVAISALIELFSS